MGTLSDLISLLELQDQQRRHDEVAHRDILCLSVRDRLKHMVLHHAKYAGKLYGLSLEDDTERVLATVVDAFIICLATANILNLDLQKRVLGNIKVVSFAQGGAKEDTCQFEIFLRTLVVETGHMAKACESLDHVEKFDYRTTIEDSTVELTRALLSLSSERAFDLPAAVRRRWLTVEQKSIFACKTNVHSDIENVDSVSRYPKRKA